MKVWIIRFGLSLMMVVGLWTSRAPAQQCVGNPGEVFVAPTVPFNPDHHPEYPPLALPPKAPPSKCAVVRTLNYFGMGYEADSFNCTGSFMSEMRWIFSSSHVWFEDRSCPCGQPCADRRNP